MASIEQGVLVWLALGPACNYSLKLHPPHARLLQPCAGHSIPELLCCSQPFWHTAVCPCAVCVSVGGGIHPEVPAKLRVCTTDFAVFHIKHQTAVGVGVGNKGITAFLRPPALCIPPEEMEVTVWPHHQSYVVPCGWLLCCVDLLARDWLAAI